MSVIFNELSRSGWQTLHDLAMSMYLDGQCYEFALALHKGLGRPLVGLFHKGTIRHALIQLTKDKQLMDVRGLVTNVELGRPFNLKPPYKLKRITCKDLFKVRPVNELDITMAMSTAQALWPALPWIKSSFSGRTKAFLKDLATICKKHHVWLRPSFSAHPIVLSEMIGDDSGFKFTPTLDGQYFVDRTLSS